MEKDYKVLLHSDHIPYVKYSMGPYPIQSQLYCFSIIFCHVKIFISAWNNFATGSVTLIYLEIPFGTNMLSIN